MDKLQPIYSYAIAQGIKISYAGPSIMPPPTTFTLTPVTEVTVPSPMVDQPTTPTSVIYVEDQP